MPKTHTIHLGGGIHPQGELYPPTVIQGPPPKPPRRWWGFLWRGAVALHELYHHAADILEHIGDLFRRRRQPKPGTP